MLINDASITGSLIVNASASLQNISLGGNIIPDETNLRNLGSTAKYFKEIYVSTGSINFVDGGSVVAVLSAGTITAIQSNTSSANSRLTALESVSASLQSFTASISTTNTFTSSATARLNALETSSASVDTLNTTQSNRLGSLETISASNISRIGSIETITSSNISRLSALETTSASVDTLNTTQNTRLTNLEIKTGSLATTGSNTFIGTQTITGSLYISSDLVVQGSSSLQNITASAVSIGTNLINLNTANPAIRYAGLSIGDSGSVGGSGSFLYDSVQDEMIFVHRGANTTVTSSVVLMGPQTFDNIGGETYPTNNLIQKGTGNEHLVDSCIFDNGGCVGINCATPSYNLDVNGTLNVATSTGSQIRLISYGGSSAKIRGTQATLGIEACGALTLETNGANERLRIESSGVASFSCQICAPSFIGGTMGLSASTADYAATITNVQDSSQGLLIRATDNDAALYLLNLQSSPGATCQSWVDRFVVAKGGNVGIGVANPAVKLQLDGSLTLKSCSNQTIQLWNSGSVAANIGGNLEFRGTYRNSDNDSVAYGKIFGGKENASDGNFAGYLSFSTYEYPNSLAERVRISSGGYLGIGTTDPPEPLSVSFASHGLISQHRQSCGVGVGQNFYMKFNNVVGSPVSYAGIYSDIQTNTNGAHSGRMILQIANAGNLLSALTISNNGAVSTACCLSVGSSADASGGFGTMIAYQPYGAASFSCNLNTLGDGTYIVTASMVRGGDSINQTYSAMWIYHHYANSGGTDIINTIVSSNAPGNNNGQLSLSGTTVSIGWGGARGPASISALRLRTS